LNEKSDWLHLPVIGILSTARFVTFKVNDKNQTLSETFRQVFKSNRSTKFLWILYFSTTEL
jgi:hypothetical protein